jgi:hypothetical protein
MLYESRYSRRLLLWYRKKRAAGGSAPKVLRCRLPYL